MSQSASASVSAPLESGAIHQTLETSRLIIRFLDPSRPSDYDDLLSIYAALRVIRDIGPKDIFTAGEVDKRTMGRSIPPELLTKSPIAPPTYFWQLVYLKSDVDPRGISDADVAAPKPALVVIGHIEIVYVPGVTVIPSLGYAFKPNFWGKGYATEGVQAVLRYYSEDLGLKELAASTTSANPASARVIVKAGGHEVVNEANSSTDDRGPRKLEYRWNFSSN